MAVVSFDIGTERDAALRRVTEFVLAYTPEKHLVHIQRFQELGDLEDLREAVRIAEIIAPMDVSDRYVDDFNAVGLEEEEVDFSPGSPMREVYERSMSSGLIDIP